MRRPQTFVKVGNRDATGKCSVGEPDFQAVKDMHIGIVSSSLGSHGAPSTCDDAADVARMRTDPHNNDRGHLVTRGATASTPGFLAFTGGDADSITNPFKLMVTGIGQHGCGYEAQLESIYRFLIDPDPYDTLTVPVPLAPAVLAGTDSALLAQRADSSSPRLAGFGHRGHRRKRLLDRRRRAELLRHLPFVSAARRRGRTDGPDTRNVGVLDEPQRQVLLQLPAGGAPGLRGPG